MADHPPTPPVEIVASPSVDETMLEPPADSAIQEQAQLPPSDGRTEPIFSSANEASIPLSGEIDPQLPHPHAQAGDHVPASGNVEGDAMDVEPGTSVTPSAAAPGPNAHDDENKNEQQTAGPNLWAEQMRFQRQRDWIAAVGTQYPPPAPAPATAAPAAATPTVNDTAMGDTAAAPGSVMQNEVVGSGTAETADSAVVSGYEDGDFGELEVDVRGLLFACCAFTRLFLLSIFKSHRIFCPSRNGSFTSRKHEGAEELHPFSSDSRLTLSPITPDRSRPRLGFRR